MSEQLADQYEEMWASAVEQFHNSKCSIDPLIDSNNDARRGITLSSRLTKEIKVKVENFQTDLRQIEPEQYYYPPSSLHLTILSIISCYSGFQLNAIKWKWYSEIILGCLAKPIEIEFKGITASPAGIMIQGFPRGDALDELRDRLRKGFKDSSLENSIDVRYRISTAHFTIMRFRKPIVDSERLLKSLKSFRTYSFGSMVIDKLYLVCNDWYHRDKNVYELDTFVLK